MSSLLSIVLWYLVIVAHNHYEETITSICDGTPNFFFIIINIIAHYHHEEIITSICVGTPQIFLIFLLLSLHYLKNELPQANFVMFIFMHYHRSCKELCKFGQDEDFIVKHFFFLFSWNHLLCFGIKLQVIMIVFMLVQSLKWNQ